MGRPIRYTGRKRSDHVVTLEDGSEVDVSPNAVMDLHPAAAMMLLRQFPDEFEPVRAADVDPDEREKVREEGRARWRSRS